MGEVGVMVPYNCDHTFFYISDWSGDNTNSKSNVFIFKLLNIYMPSRLDGPVFNLAGPLPSLASPLPGSGPYCHYDIGEDNNILGWTAISLSQVCFDSDFQAILQ